MPRLIAENPEVERRFGTQAIERAVRILRELTLRPRLGWGLNDLSARCGLSHSSVHRLLGALVREGLAVQRRSDRRYLPGPLVFDLGLSMSAHAEFVAACQRPLQKLARQFDAQAILFLRSGPDWVCGALSGTPAYLGGGLEPGIRRPLITTAGGVAMLIAMEAAVADELIGRNMQQLDFLGRSAIARLLIMLERSRALGFAWNRGETNRGIHSLGVPITLVGAMAPVLASVALSGTDAIITEARVPAMIESMREISGLIKEKAESTFSYLDRA